MTETVRPTSLTEVCKQLSDLTLQAADLVRDRVIREDELPSSVGEFFEDLANIQLDIAQVASALHRGR